MDEETIQSKLDELRDGKIKQLHVTKDEFMMYRKYIVNRSDFKHFRGIAQHGGNVLYEYSETPRS
ncbi:hypothetical protein EJF36_07630 [Bacillus sp. HMF5848]|uniref:hypothetical protein n=1 Tax=Bacillus sp. HMF5848 TaxID=2495421 RepID=UPI000F781B79|nr:hypothetical protein [Bacillus sp. HMF5848]RSK26742.1 hypothetical protein EJF36_07630 [Bacillus sp. HMF5848]